MILKFNEHINEKNLYDTPENYIRTALINIENKILKFFDTGGDDMGLTLLSNEMSKYSNTQKHLTIKFSDGDFMYDLLISIDLEEALPNKKDNFSVKDIKKCFIKFKKYDELDFKLLNQISKNMKISDITDDFLVSLKIELDDDIDDEFGEEFEKEFD